MRISDNVTNEMAAKTGLPINQKSFNKESTNDLLDALDNKKDDWWDSSYDAKKTKEMKKAADNMMDIADVFDTEDNVNELFESARKENDVTTVADKVETFSTKFNELLDRLNENNEGLFSLYYSELKNISNDQKNEFLKMGITFDKDGHMSVKKDTLKDADLDELQSSMALFTHKANYIASRVSDNAFATEESISNRYDAYGNLFSQGTSSFDYFR
ncbi:MAG: hypothetical protein K5644_07125 [Lachnospiraceae bacterium]|nr:hypothetical protein [Lachnospiraceae bacterium]